MKRRIWMGLGACVFFLHGVACARPAGDVQRVTEAITVAPLLSPDGKNAAWPLKNGSGFRVARQDGKGGWTEAKDVVIRGVVRKAVFSPDGRYLAFENIRGGYPTGNGAASDSYRWSYIAYLEFATGTIDYAEPSFAYDHDPFWTTEGALGFTRSIAGLADEKVTVRPGEPEAPLGEDDARNRKDLESLLSAPLVYQPSRSGDGRSIAFPAREGRVRSVYFVPPGGKARALVRYADDDGQELSQVAVSLNGDLVAYVRGGAPNSKGEIPNPRSLATPPRREIFVVSSTVGGNPVLIGEGAAPQFSPDGKWLLWRPDKGVAIASVNGAGARMHIGTPLFILSGQVSNIRFSPDGQRLAYERGSAVEIYDMESGKIWIASRPAGAVDRDPSWSRDGSRLAFRRIAEQMPYVLYGYAGIPEVSRPWSVMVVEGAGRNIREVWRASTGRGSDFYPLDQDASKTGLEWSQLFWSATNEIAFIWERDGWRHLYAVPLAGGEPKLLTPGIGEIESAFISMDGMHLIYAGNIGDPDRRHIGRVAFADGKPSSLSASEEYSQWSPAPMADGSVAYVEAGWAVPPRVIIRNGDGTMRDVGGVSVPADFPAAHLATPQAVSFAASDGQTAYGQLFVPARPNGCGVLFVHGGIRRQMLLGFHYIDVYSNLYELNQYFTLRGCVVLSVEYRSSIMRGFAFRNAPDWGAGGASEYRDVLGAAKYLLARKDLGVSRLGIYGLSWGGYLTAQAIARNSDIFAAGFDMAGVHEFPGKYYPNSPVAFADGWRSPVFIASGDDDRNVDMSQTMLLIDRLNMRKKRSDLTLKSYPNEVHDIYLTFENLSDLYWRGSQFLLSYLTRHP